MTKTKITIDTGTKKYISVDTPGHGSSDEDYSVPKVFAQLDFSNFPSFHGTAEEWQDILDNSEEVKIENIGHN